MHQLAWRDRPVGRAVLVALGGVALVFALWPLTSGHRAAWVLGPAPAVTSPAVAGRPEALPVAAQSVISTALGSRARTFRAIRSAAGWRLQGGGVMARLAGRGIDLETGGGALSMTLVALGHGRRLSSSPVVSVSARANRVVYDRDGVLEWYTAGPLGIEQGFTVKHRVLGAGGPLTLVLELRGALRAREAASVVRFSTHSGRLRLRYGGLVALDASGRRLSARLELELHGRRLLVRVDDRRARYPLRIDPLIQQGPKLTPSDATVPSLFGSSVALSSDGNTALIGSPLDNNAAGLVSVFTRSSGVWTQQGSSLTPDDENGNSEFGSSVALSSDGDTALIGGPADNGFAGAAWVFTRSGSTWIQRGSKRTPSDEAVGIGAQFGSSVALSSDGKTALIGGPFDNNTVGAAWEFTDVSGTLTQNGKLTASDEISGGQFGKSVALSGDGNTALIGGPFDEPTQGALSVGAAWAFERSSGRLTQVGSKLNPSDQSPFSTFGASVALSSDGHTALIGSPDEQVNGNNFTGAAWVFTGSSGAFAQQGSKLTASDEIGDGQFATSVTLSSDGASALIGGPLDNSGVGGAWLFGGSSGALTQQGPKRTPTDATGLSEFGFSVALASDGQTALMGGPFDSNRSGAAWVFTPPPPTCANVASGAPAGGGATAVQLSCAGARGASLSYAIVTGPAHGSVGAINQANGQVTYTSQSGFTGQDTFTYQASDQWGGKSNLGTVTITVPPAPPSCQSVSASTPPGGGAATVTLACTAPSGFALGYAIVTGPAHGSLGAINQTNGQVTYTAQSGYTGQDTFTYQASDAGGASNTATATITIQPVLPPVCADTASGTPGGGGGVTLLLPCTGPAGVALTYTIVSTPAHGKLGAVDGAVGSVRYTPSTGFAGTDRFTYRASDAGGASNTATATITVSPAALRPTPTMSWNFSPHPTYTSVLFLVVSNVPALAKVKVSCAGPGCGFRSRSASLIHAPRCIGKHCRPAKKPSKKPRPHAHTVLLTGLFRGLHLRVDTRITVSVVQPDTIGRVFLFRMRASRQPAITITCLAPGSHTPGRGC